MIITVAAFSVLILSFIFSMLGLGGAMLYIPVFHWLGLNLKYEAIPTGLLLNGITALSAAIVYIRSGMVDIKGTIPLVIFSFIGAPIGAYFTKMLPVNLLIFLFAVAMIFAGFRMLFTNNKIDGGHVSLPKNRRLAIMSIGGFIIGMIAGLLGVGGGFLFVPLMLSIGYPIKRAAATSSFVVVFSSFSGFAGHIAEGHWNFQLMLFTGIAVIIGSQIGSRVMKDKMKPKWIKGMFAVILLAVAAKLLIKLSLGI